MNILVTGSGGFIGKNLMQWLSQARRDDEVVGYDIGTGDLAQLCRKADFVFHLAGVNRPIDSNDFETGNKTLTEQVLQHCIQGKKPPVLLASSTQAALGNGYGKSKKAAEEAAYAYGKETGSPVYIHRLPGVFGKWCRPNYNSVVATFCHNIANGLPIEVRDPNHELTLVYIDDVCRAFLQALDSKAAKGAAIFDVHTITLGKLAETLKAFRESHTTLKIPDMADAFTKKLHSTYFSYLPNFLHPLTVHADERGSFAELLKSPSAGQVSVNITKPGYTKGNHWHHTKIEKFITVSGQGLVRFRKIGSNDIEEYIVNSNTSAVINIPPGYTHSLENTGTTDLITIMWANEMFDTQHPDTFYEQV